MTTFGGSQPATSASPNWQCMSSCRRIGVSRSAFQTSPCLGRACTERTAAVYRHRPGPRGGQLYLADAVTLRQACCAKGHCLYGYFDSLIS